MSSTSQIAQASALMASYFADRADQLTKAGLRVTPLKLPLIGRAMDFLRGLDVMSLAL